MSMERVIYAQTGEQAALAVVEDGRLCEYLPDAQMRGGLAESIFKGRVERVVPGMHAAFVRLGLEKNGFLPLEENSKTVSWPALQSGQDVLVQVKKEPAGQKGAFLTRDITLAGQYVLYMPMNRYIGVSARVENAEERAELSARGEALAQGRFGLVMRAAALEAAQEDVAEEVELLRQRFEQVQKAAPTAPAPSLLEAPRDALTRLMDDYLSRGGASLVTNDAELAQSWQCRVSTVLQPELRIRALPGMEKQLQGALRRVVWLNSGANLFIDPCEAMTVVDVNSAKFTGKRGLEDTVLRLNLEACEEIARQVRLRNLSGIVLIDFVDMAEEAHRQQVMETLASALAADRIKTILHGFTSLGLMEMTRKKTSLPLRELMTSPCSACEGTGRVERRGAHA